MCVIYATKSFENFKNVAVGHTKEFEQILARGNKIYLYKNGEKKGGGC